MKYGIRKPSVKKSISARTTGKVKRQIKKSVNPLYGKKGMGVINNPKKAAYNAVYNKTTVGVNDLLNSDASIQSANENNNTSIIAVFFYCIVAFFKLLVVLISSLFWLALLIGILYFMFVIIF